VTFVGSALPVRCSTNSTDVCWEFYPSHSSIPKTIFTGREVNRQYTGSHHVTVEDRNAVTMTLRNAQLRDAGVYHCRECASVRYAAIEVVVLGIDGPIYQISYELS